MKPHYLKTLHPVVGSPTYASVVYLYTQAVTIDNMRLYIDVEGMLVKVYFFPTKEQTRKDCEPIVAQIAQVLRDFHSFVVHLEHVPLVEQLSLLKHQS